jgi:NADH:ubiquinone oxidoreductase subunit 2 (subunit N)
VLKVIFVEEPSTSGPPINLDFLQRISLAVLAMAILFLGVVPGPLVTRITASLP